MNSIEQKSAIIHKVRIHLLDKIKDLDAVQLNTVPPGFSNNIIWNLGHLVAAQQSICYIRAGLPPIVSQSYYDLYKPGSRPDEFVKETQIDEIKNLLENTLPKLVEDHRSGIFSGYTAWTTRYDVTISNIEEATEFLLYHEGLHAGVIGSMIKLVQ